MITKPRKWDTSTAFMCTQHDRELGSGDHYSPRRWATFAKAARTRLPYGCSRRIRAPEPSTNDWAGNPTEPASLIRPPTSATDCLSAELGERNCSSTHILGLVAFTIVSLTGRRFTRSLKEQSCTLGCPSVRSIDPPSVRQQRARSRPQTARLFAPSASRSVSSVTTVTQAGSWAQQRQVTPQPSPTGSMVSSTGRRTGTAPSGSERPLELRAPVPSMSNRLVRGAWLGNRQVRR